jgi:hypothetical protein
LNSIVQNISIVRKIRLTLSIILATLALAAECAAPKQNRDPLEGWLLRRNQSPLEIDKTIAEDYGNYVQTLPAEERGYVNENNIRFLEDSAGQEAVSISIFLDGVWWQHILIYDKDKHRVKAIKYVSGRYRS